MHPTAADEIVSIVRQRAREGDCPTILPFSKEQLEEVILELADRPARTMTFLAQALRKFAPDIAEQITQRWRAAMEQRDTRFEAFLAVMREQP